MNFIELSEKYFNYLAYYGMEDERTEKAYVDALKAFDRLN